MKSLVFFSFILVAPFYLFAQNGTGYPFSNPNNDRLKKNRQEEINRREIENRKVQNFHGVTQIPTNEEILNGRYAQQIEYRRLQREKQVKEILYEDKIEYKIPDYRSPKFTEGYQIYLSAFKELNAMLSGERKADIKRAVFITENSFYGNQLSYQTFCTDIDKAVEICRLKTQNMKLNYTDKFARAAILKSFFSDTIKAYSAGKLLYRHYPYSYDFADYAAEKDWTKMFVTKLIRTNSGQCHSLPLLFKILAQEMDIDAYLSYAPSHIYIQMKDARGNMYNFETTNGNFGSNSWLMSSGFIKASAVKNRIYMDTLSIRQSIAHCLVDLGMGYKEKYGMDDFVLSCCESALNYHSNNIYAICLMSDIITVYFKKELNISGNPPPSEINSFPKLKGLYELMLDHYEQIDALGYEEMPKEIYQQWLQSLEEEKNKMEAKRLNNQFSVKTK